MKNQIPKGTRDFLPTEMRTRRSAIEKIRNVFNLFGFGEWDGPAFEYLKTLTRKSGEGVINEIYSFKDKAGRKLGLRFELTASLARIVANKPDIKKPFKVYNIGKVWRYERPQAGRFREFWQADADIFGSYFMDCEVELLTMTSFILKGLGLKNYRIRLNNRKILEAQIRIAGINDAKKEDVLMSLDKLAKIGKEGVKKEFIQRGLTEKEFVKFMPLVLIKGDNKEKLDRIKDSLGSDSGGIEGVKELYEIIEKCNELEVGDMIYIDTSLVRGLAYYTGPIFEVEMVNQKELGSFVGGGRYDTLVKVMGGQSTGAVGISFGIERLIEILTTIQKENENSFSSQVFIANALPEFKILAFQIANMCRKDGISSENDISNRSLAKQLAYVNSANIPYVIIIVSKTKFKFKNMSDGKEVEVRQKEIIPLLKKYLK